MIRANRLFLALALCVSSACGLFFDTDELRQPGTTGGGGNAGNDGAPGGGAAGPGMNGGGGSGGNGGFGGGSTPVGCDAPGYCGPSSICEQDGFCSVVNTEAPEDVVGVAFIRGGGEGQAEGYVVAHSSAGFGSSDRLSSWPLRFNQGELSLLGTAQIDDAGVGFLAAAGQQRLLLWPVTELRRRWEQRQLHHRLLNQRPRARLLPPSRAHRRR